MMSTMRNILGKQCLLHTSAGGYIVSLSIKQHYDSLDCIGSSRPKTYIKFLRNEASPLRSPSLKLDYDAVLLEYKSLSHTAKMNLKNANEGVSYYLSHHAVFKPESSFTKVRVVFNASSKTSC